MKMLRIAAYVCALTVASVWIASAQNAKLDFTLINKTGVDIHYVFLSPHDSDDWGEDVMGKDVLVDGASVDIVFSPKTNTKLWDLKVTSSDEKDAVEWESLDLSKIEELTLKMVKGKPVAEWK